MTVTISYSDASDGRIRSNSSAYATALSGNNLDVDTTTNSFGTWGQSRTTNLYTIYQYFARFPYTLDSDSLIVSAYFAFTGSVSNETGVDRDLEVREYNWGTVVNTSDWRTPTQLGNLIQLAESRDAQTVSGGQRLRCGSEELTDRLDTTGEVRVVVCSSRNRKENTPSSREFTQLRTADYSGTASDPALVYATIPISTLDRYLGAQAQLSDGTHMVLEHDAQQDPDNAILLRHHDGTSASTVATLSKDELGNLHGRGAQAAALTVDDDDNIYVVGRAAFTRHSLTVQPFVKQSGYSWSAGTIRQVALSSYTGSRLNNTAVGWHNTGSGGTLLAVASHESATNSGVEMSYALLDCSVLLAGSGTVVRDSGSAYGAGLIRNVSSAGFHNFQNETGSMLDLCATPGSDTRGWLVSTDRQHILGSRGAVSVTRYVLNPGGDGFAEVNNTASSPTYATKDPQAKLRVVGVNATEFVVVSADEDAGAGLTVTHWQHTGSSFNLLARAYLDAESLSTMPTAGALAAASTWDAIYDSVSHGVWVYYFDQGNDQRLMRTHVNLDTGLAGQDETEVNSSVGASGSTNHAIRVHRGSAQGLQVLVTVANETSGGTHTTTYVVDQLNVAPSKPSLVSKANFDATNEAEFEWTFNDPGDTQSAYQLQINDSTGTSAYDTGKTVSSDNNHTLPASSLTNPGDWQWRVRTWDALDEVSPYSDFGDFSTSASGTVTIVNPDGDNPDDVQTDSYQIDWSVSGTTQAEYRVVVVRTSDSSELVNTGWVASAATSYEITGMQTEVEYEVQLTVRDGSAVETNTATRLITPNYSNPPVPAVTVAAVNSGGYVDVMTENPEIGEELDAAADGTFETGVGDWETTNGTLEQTSAQAFEDDFSGLLTVTGSPSETTLRATQPNWVTVVPGRQYTVNFQAYSPSGYSDLAQAITWYDESDTLVSTSSNSSAITSGLWIDRTGVFYAPLTAESASYGPTLASSPPSGTVLYVDELQMLNASDQPPTAVNEIYRRVAGSGTAYVLLGTTEANGTFRDYTARSGVSYEYFVRAVASDDRYADSATATLSTPLALQGVWVHDPADPRGTVEQYAYGRAARSTGLEMSQQPQHFAGRQDPVTDYGEHRVITYQISIAVPHGSSWGDDLERLQWFAQARRVLVLRDNRGRGGHGSLSGYGETDQTWGTQVRFSFTVVDREETTVA